MTRKYFLIFLSYFPWEKIEKIVDDFLTILDKKNMEIERALRKSLVVDELPSVDINRLESDIVELGSIGRNENDGGIYRMAFSDADFQARHWLIKKIEEFGLKSSIDGAFNIFGLDDRAQTRSSFLIGSHLDSVPCGGVLDGAYGVLAALECMRIIKEYDIPLKENLELVATSDEEGLFGGMLGSQAICGELTLETIRQMKDLHNRSLTEVMENCGLTSTDILKARRHRQYMSGFLELHIEQGPILDSQEIDIGIVESISGCVKWKIELIGLANHSGTTPMNMRIDALQGFSEFANEIPRVLEENGSEYARATIGKVDLFPGNPHIIPGKVEFTIVFRDFNDEGMNNLEEGFRRTLSAISRRRKLKFHFYELSQISPTQNNTDLLSLIEEEANNLQVKNMRMYSGAGHDAQIFGRYIPTAMIFIPSLNGISHSPDEWSSLEHIEMGANLLLRTVLRKLKVE